MIYSHTLALQNLLVPRCQAPLLSLLLGSLLPHFHVNFNRLPGPGITQQRSDSSPWQAPPYPLLVPFRHRGVRTAHACPAHLLSQSPSKPITQLVSSSTICLELQAETRGIFQANRRVGHPKPMWALRFRT